MKSDGVIGLISLRPSCPSRRVPFISVNQIWSSRVLFDLTSDSQSSIVPNLMSCLKSSSGWFSKLGDQKSWWKLWLKDPNSTFCSSSTPLLWSFNEIILMRRPLSPRLFDSFEPSPNPSTGYPVRERPSKNRFDEKAFPDFADFPWPFKELKSLEKRWDVNGLYLPLLLSFLASS